MTATSNPIINRLTAQIAHHQRLSDRLHANGDAAARQHEWDITPTTGRLGFGGASTTTTGSPPAPRVTLPQRWPAISTSTVPAEGIPDV